VDAFSASLDIEKEIQKKIMKEDLENQSSHLPNYEFFREDIFNEGLNVAVLARDIDVADTEDWNSTELSAWKTDFANTVTYLLNVSAYTVFDVATQFAPYTSKPEYLSERESAEQELLLAWEALSRENVSEAYGHFYFSWKHSWNAMVFADEIPPYIHILSNKISAAIGEQIIFNSYGSYDIAGPCTYQWMSSYSWDYGDGSADWGIKTQHAYAQSGTYVVTLRVTDRSGNTKTSSLAITVGGGVGGIWVPVDKFGLLAPYLAYASTILVAAVVAAVCVKRVKRRKENQ